MEIRCPDPAGNPYLQFTVLCLSGLDGIRRGLKPPEPAELNVYKLSYEERKQRNIISLPESLSEALLEIENSEFMKAARPGTLGTLLERKAPRMGSLPNASYSLGSRTVSEKVVDPGFLVALM